ncbi:MAG TPA: hypothetical protein VN784_03430 [Candidatus Limnocylindrales bacterium]|nr:hypothetical protein [Candidatus Limnocylindrales bacterium]
MKQIRLILAIVLGAVFSLSANATTILTEQFLNYTSGYLGNVGIGGGGTIPGWNSAKSHIVVTNGSGSLSGTNLGLVSSAGDMVYILRTAETNDNFDTNAAGVPNGCYNLFVQKVPTLPNLNATNANFSLYTSFLYRFNDNTNFPGNGVAMIAGMYLQSGGIQSGTPQGIDAYWQLFARTNSSGQIQLGIAKNIFNTTPAPANPGVTNWDPTMVGVGQTFFVVVRLQVVATNGVSYYTNDEADLWINPPVNSFGTNEANVPTPDVISPPLDGAPISSATGPGRFFIVDNGPTANLDELRIGTNSWADVTPPFGQCNPAGFTLNLTNITQSAEINASFYTKSEDSTAPTYQWQISRDGGSTWSNISGAISQNYTTPNLQYPADNGNEYRTIAYVSCDNTYATSSVATVTLTAPTATSPGVIMNDTFGSSTFRDVGPVTSTHSVWYTGNASPSASSDLVTDPGGTGLIATTIAGTSSLYLGYYVNETATSKVPLDLAIGTQITATLEFTPNSFGAFTNNGSLRFGLYDYADSGTLYSADDSTLTGSLGNGRNVRGYMLDLDFGKFFSTSNPLSLYVRDGLQDNNLAGTTGDYLSMGSGPFNGAYSNVAAFQAGTTYTLALTVARTATNNCTVTATITGGSLNLTYSAADTNSLGYHRFDTIAVRPNKAENAADTFTFPLFNVQVASAPVSVSNVAITGIQDIRSLGTNNVTTNTVTLTWQPTPAVNSSLFFVQRKDNSLTDTWSTVASQLPSTTTTFTDTVTNNVSFYRVYGQ